MRECVIAVRTELRQCGVRCRLGEGDTSQALGGQKRASLHPVRDIVAQNTNKLVRVMD